MSEIKTCSTASLQAASSIQLVCSGLPDWLEGPAGWLLDQQQQLAGCSMFIPTTVIAPVYLVSTLYAALSLSRPCLQTLLACYPACFSS